MMGAMMPSSPIPKIVILKMAMMVTRGVKGRLKNSLQVAKVSVAHPPMKPKEANMYAVTCSLIPNGPGLMW